MQRSRWISLGLSIALHGTVLVGLVLLLGPRPMGREGGPSLRVELPPDTLPESLSEEPPEADDPIVEPDLPESFEPTLPDAAPVSHRPLPPDAVLSREPPEDRDLFLLPEVPVHVAGLPSRRPEKRRALPPAVSVPPPAAAPARPARPTTLVPIHQPRHYPREAYRVGLEGRARVEITIGADGRVQGARLTASSGHAVLDEAALGSARRWRFQPPGRVRRAVIPFTYAMP